MRRFIAVLAALLLLTGCAAGQTPAQSSPSAEPTVLTEPLTEDIFRACGDGAVLDFANGFDADPPQALTLVLDREDSFTDTVEDAQTIAGVFDALANITVGERAEEYTTDDYTTLRFTYGDGREYAFSFNGHALELPVEDGAALFRLYGDDGLWALLWELYAR